MDVYDIIDYCCHLICDSLKYFINDIRNIIIEYEYTFKRKNISILNFSSGKISSLVDIENGNVWYDIR